MQRIRHLHTCASSSSSSGEAEGSGSDEQQQGQGRETSQDTSSSDEAGASRSSSGGGGVPDSLPLLGSDTDWRQFRARLVAQERGVESPVWAHTVPKPEKGALLLAHPLMFTSSQEYFYQAVILLLDHDENGSFGVILNRPSQFTLGQLALTKDLSVFDACRLFIGGDVGDGTLQVVHTTEGLPGSVEVVKGVHMGGIEGARQKVEAGEAVPDEFRWFARYSGWGAGQLEGECRSGVWFTCAASPELVTQLPKDANGRDYYHKILQLLGGDHKVLSDKILEAEAKEGRPVDTDTSDEQ